MRDSGTDQASLEVLGSDLRRQRLSRNLSQSELADEAGVSRNTVRRLEAGDPVSTLTLLRILRALGLADRLEGLAPDRGPGPLEQLSRGPRGRQRARKGRSDDQSAAEWRWSDEDER